jgi:hypothetical protein
MLEIHCVWKGPRTSSGSTLPEILPSALAAYFNSSAPITISRVESSNISFISYEVTQKTLKIGDAFSEEAPLSFVCC